MRILVITLFTTITLLISHNLYMQECVYQISRGDKISQKIIQILGKELWTQKTEQDNEK
jgi:hypothetical protein